MNFEIIFQKHKILDKLSFKNKQTSEERLLRFFQL